MPLSSNQPASVSQAMGARLLGGPHMSSIKDPRTGVNLTLEQAKALGPLKIEWTGGPSGRGGRIGSAGGARGSRGTPTSQRGQQIRVQQQQQQAAARQQQANAQGQTQPGQQQQPTPQQPQAQQKQASDKSTGNASFDKLMDHSTPPGGAEKNEQQKLYNNYIKLGYSPDYARTYAQNKIRTQEWAQLDPVQKYVAAGISQPDAERAVRDKAIADLGLSPQSMSILLPPPKPPVNVSGGASNILSYSSATPSKEAVAANTKARADRDAIYQHNNGRPRLFNEPPPVGRPAPAPAPYRR